MNRIRQTTTLPGSRSVGTPGSRSRQVRVATEVYEPSSDESTVRPEDSGSEWPITEEFKTESIQSFPETSSATPARSRQSRLMVPVLISLVGVILGRTIAGAAAFATMILLITVGGLGAACLTYWLWKVFNRMVRSRQKT